MMGLENEDTWPEEIINLLQEKSDLIDKENKLGKVFYDTREKIQRILFNLEIRAYHCTKLTDSNLVKQNGLIVLKPHLIKKYGIEGIEQDRNK